MWIKDHNCCRNHSERLVYDCTKARNRIYYIIKILFTILQTDAGWEEYYDYIFPDETTAQPNLKLLAMAKKWKQTQEQPASEVDDNNVTMDTQSD